VRKGEADLTLHRVIELERSLVEVALPAQPLSSGRAAARLDRDAQTDPLRFPLSDSVETLRGNTAAAQVVLFGAVAQVHDVRDGASGLANAFQISSTKKSFLVYADSPTDKRVRACLSLPAWNALLTHC
jgi:hypothetical protein